MKVRAFTLIAAAAVALFAAGCAGGYYTSGAYYSPNYRAYYSDYGYRGGPYYGYNPGYIGGFVISGGRRYHRYYGHHHFRGHRQAIHRGSRHRGREHAGRSDDRRRSSSREHRKHHRD